MNAMGSLAEPGAPPHARRLPSRRCRGSALLFDMLLLSQGLVISMRVLLERTGLRPPRHGDRCPAWPGPSSPMRSPALTPSRTCRRSDPHCVAVRQRGRSEGGPARPVHVLPGCRRTNTHPWTMLRGRDIATGPEIVINENASRRAQLQPGDRVYCGRPAPTTSRRCRRDVHCQRVADFPSILRTAPPSRPRSTCWLLRAEATNSMRGCDHGCLPGECEHRRRAVDVAQLLPELSVLSNAEAVSRFERAASLFPADPHGATTVTLSFAVLLITVLLTVSCEPRLGEIARAACPGILTLACRRRRPLRIGPHCRRWRLLSLPSALSWRQVSIGFSSAFPHPAEVHFFVFEPPRCGSISCCSWRRHHRGTLPDSNRRATADRRDAAG